MTVQTFEFGSSFLKGPIKSGFPLNGFKMKVSLIFLLTLFNFCPLAKFTTLGEGEEEVEWGGDTPGDNWVSVNSSSNFTWK